MGKYKEDPAYRKGYRARYYFRKFGIDIEEFLKEHGNRCEICQLPETRYQNGKTRTLVIDENPITRIPRGVLCIHCNLALGTFRDNPIFLEAGIQYLRKYGYGN